MSRKAQPLPESIELGVFDDLTLLRLAVEETPTAIFPDRAIGRLREGFKANFVVLGENPLQDFGAVRDVRAVYKSGVLIWSREGDAE
jgi:predicted amidohydrolase YtcJ